LGFSATGQAVLNNNDHYVGGALGLQNKAAF
jgi:hypothetical protein